MSKHELELKEKNVRHLLIGSDMVVYDEHYAGHPWSIVKLVLLGQWAYVYTVILKNWSGGIRYVDLLAGSGTTLIQETGDIIKGSPFAVKEFAFKPFDDYILVEKDEARYKALSQNAKALGKITPPIRGDCNRFVREIFSNQHCHNFVFIDMEGFDVTWESMEQIIKSKSDIMINFPTSSYERTKALENQQCLDKFYGDNTWAEKAVNREKFLNLYMKKLSNAFRDSRKQTPYVEAIRVGNRSYFYDIILLCKHGAYVDVWGNYMKSKWNWQNPREMQNLLNYLKGRETRLDSFIPLSKHRPRNT
jgi:three-Cys-motif partner protein